ncbi:hypothetical protein VTN77DRAFT_3953 [Rasamsonia byssochlamydoides]|uniref:uncharacterized protein n=1 Tax=Rasamsonia byssochlamydoides TaxID=89139 RepID=UPI003743F696
MAIHLRRPLSACLQFVPRTAPGVTTGLLLPISVRHASLTSAIEKGIRKSRAVEFSTRGKVNKNEGSSRKEDHLRNVRKKKRGKDHEYSDTVPERIRTNCKIPTSIPYTTPASEFIYGTSAVHAALRCTRRQLYKLYLYQAEGEELTPEKVTIRKLALSKGIKVKMTWAQWTSILDKMSDGRPHNGCVLEASPLPKLPVTGLEPVESPFTDHFRVSLGQQSQEEAAVNGTDNRIPVVGRLTSPSAAESENPRYPFVILLDGILDPGNMGAIIRSAYYLGVDAIVLTGRNSAPLSPVTIKASAGAAENMTLLKANNEIDFIRRSRANGWRFYAAEAPGNLDLLAGNNAASGSNDNNSNSILTTAPTVLMLGNEGTGLLPRIRAQADGFVSIPGARIRPELSLDDPARVDSLNVSVAAALLMEMFMRVPLRVVNVSPSPNSTPATPTEEEKQAPRSFDFN